MNLTMHIIYVPGTVKYLRLFTLSLLKWLPCSFRLIPMAVPGGKPFAPAILCAISPLRIYDVALGQDETAWSGVVLLQQQETSEYFGFVDSDIWASGIF